MQKVFGAEVRALSSWDFGLGNGDASSGLGVPLELFHLHRLQQNVDYGRPFRDEGQSSVLPFTLRDARAGGLRTLQSHRRGFKESVEYSGGARAFLLQRSGQRPERTP